MGYHKEDHIQRGRDLTGLGRTPYRPTTKAITIVLNDNHQNIGWEVCSVLVFINLYDSVQIHN